MYHAHSKDINRNKSFHSLTFKNLRRVELLKEKEEEKQKAKEERHKELQRDQEQRRYDELIGGEGAFTGDKHVKNIFAAEYEREEVTDKADDRPKTVLAANTGLHFLKKFVKDETLKPEAREGHMALKRNREDEEDAEGERHRSVKQEDNTSSSLHGGVQTGFVSTSEAFRMRKELELSKKTKEDPLAKVKAYENQTVAAAAEAQSKKKNGASTGDSQMQEAIRARMKQLLSMKKST